MIRKEAIEEPPISPDFRGNTFRIFKALWLDYFQGMLATSQGLSKEFSFVNHYFFTRNNALKL